MRDRSGIGEVEGDGGRRAAGGDDVRGGLLRGVDCDVADHDPAAFGPEPGGRRGADAGGAADPTTAVRSARPRSPMDIDITSRTVEDRKAWLGFTGSVPEPPIWRRRPMILRRRLGNDIWMSPGVSNSYAVATEQGRVIVNAGLVFEGPLHRKAFADVPGPARAISSPRATPTMGRRQRCVTTAPTAKPRW